jgi:hypothetical protein
MTYRSRSKMIAIDQFLDELLCHTKIQIKFEFGFIALIMIYKFSALFFFFLRIDILFDIWYIALADQVRVRFWSINFSRSYVLWTYRNIPNYQFSALFSSLLTDIHDLVHCFAISSCRSSSSLLLIHWFFTKLRPMDLEKYYELSVFCTFVVSPTGFAVSNSYKSKFSFVLLELLFDWIYIACRGLGLACNTLRMLVWKRITHKSSYILLTYCFTTSNCT